MKIDRELWDIWTKTELDSQSYVGDHVLPISGLYLTTGQRGSMFKAGGHAMTRQKTYAKVYVRRLAPPVDGYNHVVIAKKPDGAFETEWFRELTVAESVAETRRGMETDPAVDPFVGVGPHRNA